MTEKLIKAIEASEADIASEHFKEMLKKGGDPWEIHRSIFPVVQKVLNPPYINPHLPKMYAVNRELVPYLEKTDIPALVHLEIIEYAKRPKLKPLPKQKRRRSMVSFSDIESAISYQDWEMTADYLSVFYAQKGGAELAHRMLLLGSGHLDDSLGHSVSCTAFILLEMLQRTNQDPWPALATLADYFCKGRFHNIPPSSTPSPDPSDTYLRGQLLRATSGSGIVDLHHTITLYAIERARHFFNKEEYRHMIGAWVAFMENKKAEPIILDLARDGAPVDYDRFFKTFSKLQANKVLGDAAGMIAAQEGRQVLGRFLVKAVCDLYQGNYNPHYLTGLGSTLWIIDRYGKDTSLVNNSMFQYLDFFFDGIK